MKIYTSKVNYTPPDADYANHVIKELGKEISFSTEDILSAVNRSLKKMIKNVKGYPEVIELVSEGTGFSKESINRLIEYWEKINLEEAKEFLKIPNEELWDRWKDVPNTDYRAKFIPRKKKYRERSNKGIVYNVAAGNVFGVSLMPIIYSLLAGKPSITKASSREPYSAQLFKENLPDELKKYVQIEIWPGGDPNYRDVESAFLRGAENIVVVSSDEAIEALKKHMKKCGSKAKLYKHGHAFGVLLADEFANDPEIAYRAVKDAGEMYGGFACLNTKLILFDGPENKAKGFAKAVADAFEKLEKEVPKHKAQSWYHLQKRVVDPYITRKSAGNDIEIYPASRHATVIYDNSDLPPLWSVHGRSVVVKPARDFEHVLKGLLKRGLAKKSNLGTLTLAIEPKKVKEIVPVSIEYFDDIKPVGNSETPILGVSSWNGYRPVWDLRAGIGLENGRFVTVIRPEKYSFYFQ